MNLAQIPVQIKTNSVIRIDARRYVAGPPGDQVRVFTEKESGIEKPFTDHAILHMMRSGRITTDAAYRALDPSVTENLQVDWAAFSELEQKSAQFKYPFVKAIDELPIIQRDKKKFVMPTIERIAAEATGDSGPNKKVSFRSARTWYLQWLVTGRDIRALINNHRKKGNRNARYDDWIKEEAMEGIRETIMTNPSTTLEVALRRANSRIVIRAERDGLKRPNLATDEDRCIGKHLVTRMVAGMELYDITLAKHGKPEADLLLKAVRSGPSCSYPLEEAEVDHTLVDLMVVDHHGRVLGRPWLTAIIDRWSRMILGYSLSFTPPSWVSVMEALRVAVQPKEAFLQRICAAIEREPNFNNKWLCYGSASRLFVDNGPEFRSASMTATAQALAMQMVDLPRGSGWLKGRMERWFRSVNDDLFHNTPGTTKSNIRARGKYKSDKNACLTLEDLNWLLAKWIVDVYHVKTHSNIHEKPLDRWTRGILEVGERPAPPDDIIVSLTGKILRQKLTRNGVFFEGLRWNSNAFSALLNRLNGANSVTIRIDPLDLRKAYILDETRIADRESWVEGDLHADEETAKSTLYQYQVKRKAARDEAVENLDPKRLTQVARTNKEMFDFVHDRKKTSKKIPRKAARFMTGGRNASEHVRVARVDASESEQDVGAHDFHSDKLLSSPPDERGPYRDELSKVTNAQNPTLPIDVAAVEEATPKKSTERNAMPNPFDEPMVVKRRTLD